MPIGPLVLPRLVGARLVLRAWQDSDVPTVQEASHDPRITSVTTVPSTDGEPEALAFIERQRDRLRTGAGYVFAIANSFDQAVGHIGVFFAPGAGARASIGYWVAPSHRQQGYATEALSITTSWALTLRGLDRLELYVEPWNTSSWQAAERAGYAREGLLRSWERVDGTPRDMYMYSRLTAHGKGASTCYGIVHTTTSAAPRTFRDSH
jgi:ribosomal-protein-alanine N-acetyltransferase